MASEFGSVPGYIGPLDARVPVIADEALNGLEGLVAGANERDKHVRGVQPGRDFDPDGPTCAPSRRATPTHRAPRSGSSRRSRSGTSSSSAPAIPSPWARPTWTRTARSSSSGWARTASARRGSRLRPSSSSPTSRASRGRARSRRGTWSSSRSGRRASRPGRSPTGSTTSCRTRGLQVLYDDREASAGEKFADAELLGVPLRLTVGKRGIEEGEVEAQVRRGQEKRSLPLDDAAQAAADLWRDLA